MPGSEIGDLLRSWEMAHRKRLSTRKWDAAFAAAKQAADAALSESAARIAAMAAIHHMLTPVSH